jgi:hypothetical protein
MMATTPGRIQRATVTTKATATERCPRVHGPSRARSRRISSAPADNSRTPAGATALRYTYRKVNRTRTMGTPTSIQLKKGISTRSWERMKPRPMTLGGVPTGVASPPTEAANEVISMSAVAYPGWIVALASGARSAARMESPIPYIIAVVAVLEIQAEISAVTAPKASKIRLGRAPTQGRESTA